MTIEQRREQPEIVTLQRTGIREEMLRTGGEIEDSEEKRLMGAFADYVVGLSGIPEVRGVLLKQYTDGSGVNLTTVVDRLVPNTVDTSRVMREVSQAKKIVNEAMRGVFVGGSWGFCNGDFDGFVERVLEREKREEDGEEVLPSGNDFKDLINIMNGGRATSVIFKFGE